MEIIAGTIVHYVLPEKTKTERPAIIIRVGNDGTCNLQVFTDGLADGYTGREGLVWRENIPYSAEPKPNTWHSLSDHSNES